MLEIVGEPQDLIILYVLAFTKFIIFIGEVS